MSACLEAGGHTNMGKVTENDRTLTVSPVLGQNGSWRNVRDGMVENGDRRVLLLEGNGTQLMDVEGQLVYETLGWCLLRDQHGYALCDRDGSVCFEQVDEDELALMMQTVPQRVPVTAEQVDSMIEQNQQLRSELDQSLLTHWTDAEPAQKITKQRDAQVQSDFRAMRAEFEKRQVEWVKKARINKEKSETAIHVERQRSDEQHKESDAKWMAFLQQLQDNQAKRQKEADDDYACHATEMDKQHVQHEEWHVKVQQRLHVHAPLPLPLQQLLPTPPPPSQSNGLQFAPLPPHPLILVNALQQAPVVDFAQ